MPDSLPIFTNATSTQPRVEMDERNPIQRRYSDKEVGLILKRAAELQSTGPEETAAGSGLSLHELEEIAGEAGIDPRNLRRAAAELESGAYREGAWEWLTGGPVAIRLERTIPGELSESEFEGLIPEIQTAADGHGHASLVGRTLTWRSATSQGQRSTQVSIVCRDDRTRILIEERMGGLAGGLFGGIVGGVGGGLGLGVGLGVGIDVLNSVLFSVAFPAGVIGSAYMLARAIFGSIARRRRRRLRELLDQLTLVLIQREAGKAIETPSAKELDSTSDSGSA